MSELAYEDIKVGDEASRSPDDHRSPHRQLRRSDPATGTVHADVEHAAKSMFGERIAHGMLVAGLISAVLGTQLPGPNSIYLGQDLKFVAPVMIGDTIKVVVTVTDKRDEKRIIKLRTAAYNQRGEMVIDGSPAVKKVGL
jgi:3-hydroxybutyryl-CoA dehydratase